MSREVAKHSPLWEGDGLPGPMEGDGGTFDPEIEAQSLLRTEAPDPALVYERRLACAVSPVGLVAIAAFVALGSAAAAAACLLDGLPPGGQARDRPAPGRAVLSLKIGAGAGTCAPSASLPIPAGTLPNKWELNKTLQADCRSNAPASEQTAQGRNLCWMGLKDQCHAHLKAHMPWMVLRYMAAQEARVPPMDWAPFSPLEAPELCDRPEPGRVRNFSEAQTRAAYRWLREKVGVFVLNLPTDEDRWTMISSRLKTLGITPQRVQGVDMRVAGALKAAQGEGFIPKEYNFTRAQEVASMPNQSMGGVLGTLGCASGHMKAQAAAMRDGRPLALVFEDDVWAEDDFVERLWSLVTEELPCDWEVTSLYSRCPFGRCVSERLARIRPDVNEPKWRCHQGVNWGMQGMLYRVSRLAEVQAVWREAVFDEERPLCLDVDVALASVSDRVSYYAVPSVQEPGFLRETNQRSARWTINSGPAAHQEHRPVRIGMPFPT